MTKVFVELQLFLCWIARADHATRYQATTQSSTGPHQQQYIQQGQRQPRQPYSSKLTLKKRAKQRTNSATHSFIPHDGPALNHRPLDSELKTILLDALSASRLGAYKNLYQQYCNRSNNEKTFTDLYHNLFKYESNGVKSSTCDSDAEFEDRDGSRSTRTSSRSSNSHSSRSDTTAQVLTKGKQERLISQVCQVTAVSGKRTLRADQDAQA